MAPTFSILIVNNHAVQDASQDKAGPTVQATLQEKGFIFLKSTIIPSGEEGIRQILKSWCESEQAPTLVLTVGGTGYDLNERTPEAVNSLIDRQSTGLIHLLMCQSLKITPSAALSRPVAGTYKDTLIVTLPGTPKAVKENLEALLYGGILERITQYLSKERVKEEYDGASS